MRLVNLQMIVDTYETKVEEYYSLLFMEGRAGQCWEQLWKRHTGGSDSKESACNAGDLGLILRKISWRRDWQLTPVFLPRKSHRQRSLVGYSLWGHKELDRTEQLSTTTNSP